MGWFAVEWRSRASQFLGQNPQRYRLRLPKTNRVRLSFVTRLMKPTLGRLQQVREVYLPDYLKHRYAVRHSPFSYR